MQRCVLIVVLSTALLGSTTDWQKDACLDHGVQSSYNWLGALFYNQTSLRLSKLPGKTNATLGTPNEVQWHKRPLANMKFPLHGKDSSSLEILHRFPVPSLALKSIVCEGSYQSQPTIYSKYRISGFSPNDARAQCTMMLVHNAQVN